MVNPSPTEQIEPAQSRERLADAGLLSEAAVEAVNQLGAGRIWGHCARHGSRSPLMMFFIFVTIDDVSVILVDGHFIAVHDHAGAAGAAGAVGVGVVPSGEPGLGNGGEKEVALPTDGVRYRAEDGLVRAQRIRLKG